MQMHADDIKFLAQRAHRDSRVREGLFVTMLEGEGREARNAAWALTHLPSDDLPAIDAHRGELVNLALATPSTSLRRLSLTLLERLTWEEEQVSVPLLDFCLERMLSSDEPYGVRALCMKLAYQQSRHWPELCAELRQGLLLIQPDDLGAGVRHTRNKILQML